MITKSALHILFLKLRKICPESQRFPIMRSCIFYGMTMMLSQLVVTIQNLCTIKKPIFMNSLKNQTPNATYSIQQWCHPGNVPLACVCVCLHAYLYCINWHGRLVIKNIVEICYYYSCTVSSLRTSLAYEIRKFIFHSSFNIFATRLSCMPNIFLT